MIYDVAIIGGGPGGLTAGIYAVRAGLSVLLFEAGMSGGQASQTHWIDNYPGFPDGIGGMELGENMEKQAIRLGVEMKRMMVKSLAVAGEVKTITTRKEEFQAKTIILATGAKPRKLGIAGESELLGAGVSYCATCDGGFFKGKRVAVAGGGDTALGDASYLAKLAEKIYVIHRRDEFRAMKQVVDAALANPNVEPIYDTVIEKLNGETKLESLALRNVKTDKETILSVDGVFVAVGSNPESSLVEGLVERKNGYIVVDDKMQTSVEGVYAVGDVRYGAIAQVVTACASGATAVHHIVEYLM